MFCQNPLHIIGERNQQYRQELIIGICTLPDCNDRLVCQQCLGDIHNNHQNFIKKFDEIQQGIWSNYPENVPGSADQSVFKYEKEQFQLIKQKLLDYLNQIDQQFQQYCLELQLVYDACKVINLAKNDSIQQVTNNDMNSYFYILNKKAQNSQELSKVYQTINKQIIFIVEQMKLVEKQCKTEEKKSFTQLVNTYIKQKIIRDVYSSNQLNYDQVPKQYSSVKGAKILERESLNDQEIYFGELDTTSLKHGKGIQIFQEQDIIFEGIWLKNKIVWGQKILLMEKDECVILRGEMKDKKLEGEGQKISSFGIIYYGNFQNDLLNGQGKYIRIDSQEKYEGNFKDGKLNGHGKLVYAKGNVYVGEFKNNQRHGKGKLTFIQGDWYDGEFFEDCFHGKGQYYSESSQKTFIGSYVKGKKQGEFYIIYGDKTRQKEYYENDNKINESKNFFASLIKPKK